MATRVPFTANSTTNDQLIKQMKRTLRKTSASPLLSLLLCLRDFPSWLYYCVFFFYVAIINVTSMFFIFCGLLPAAVLFAFPFPWSAVVAFVLKVLSSLVLRSSSSCGHDLCVSFSLGYNYWYWFHSSVLKSFHSCCCDLCVSFSLEDCACCLSHG